MRKIICTIMFLLIILLTNSSCAENNEPHDVDVFTVQQLKTISNSNTVPSVRQIINKDGVFFAYMSDSSLYTWSLNDPKLILFSKLPNLPYIYTNSYMDTTEDEKKLWRETVTFLAPGENEIWGINIFSGKIGIINDDGIKWKDHCLNVDCLFPDEYSWPLRIVDAFVHSKKLFVYAAFDNDTYPHNNYMMVCFDIETGLYEIIDIQNSQGLSKYKDDSVILLCYENQKWITKVLDLYSLEVRESPYKEYLTVDGKTIGGVAYNPYTDQLFFTTSSQVWAAAPGEEFQAVSLIPVPYLAAEAQGFILNCNEYAVFTDQLYIRYVNTITTKATQLNICGCMDDTIYRSFIEKNPNTIVNFQHNILLPDEIARRLITQDNTADLYATLVDYSFNSIVKKGYVADLSSSRVITSDIDNIYQNIANVITNSDGNPIAYPYQIYLGNWKVNITLWHEIYGDMDFPSTYAQFFDMMIQWENDLTYEYPDISFAGNFDYTSWVRMIINAYAQQYGILNQPLSFSSDELYTNLEKLKKICEIRKENGKDTHGNDDSFEDVIDLFITAGYNNILLDPFDQETQNLTREEIPEGIYIDIPILTFKENENIYFPGKMVVWFVNPFSENKDLAIKYLEEATIMQNNPVTYYGIHKNQNSPLEWDGYKDAIFELESRKKELQYALSKFENNGNDNIILENELKEIDNEILLLNNKRWEISPSAIQQYRKIAPYICFFEDNPYVLQLGRNSEYFQQVESLYTIYTEGHLDTQSFLTQLSRRMNMILWEGL